MSINESIELIHEQATNKTKDELIEIIHEQATNKTKDELIEIIHQMKNSSHEHDNEKVIKETFHFYKILKTN